MSCKKHVLPFYLAEGRRLAYLGNRTRPGCARIIWDLGSRLAFCESGGFPTQGTNALHGEAPALHTRLSLADRWEYRDRHFSRGSKSPRTTHGPQRRHHSLSVPWPVEDEIRRQST